MTYIDYYFFFQIDLASLTPLSLCLITPFPYLFSISCFSSDNWGLCVATFAAVSHARKSSSAPEILWDVFKQDTKKKRERGEERDRRKVLEGGRWGRGNGKEGERNSVWGHCAGVFFLFQWSFRFCLALAQLLFGHNWRRGSERGRRQLKPWIL